MIKVWNSGAYLVDGKTLIADNAEALKQVAAASGVETTKEEAATGTMAYGIDRKSVV